MESLDSAYLKLLDNILSTENLVVLKCQHGFGPLVIDVIKDGYVLPERRHSRRAALAPADWCRKFGSKIG